MQFKKGVTVLDLRGEKVGEIDRVVIDPRDDTVTHVVVQKGFLFTEDKVIPIADISRTSDDEVHLKIDEDQIEELPDYTEINYLPLDDDRQTTQGPTPTENVYAYARPVYWYPTYGAAPMNWGAGYWGYTPPGAGPVSPYNYRVTEEENIPEGTVALKEGAKVLGKEGKHIGDVEKVLTENQKDQVTHLVVSKGLFGQKKKLIPANWVRHILADEVTLAVDAGIVDRLRDYDE